MALDWYGKMIGFTDEQISAVYSASAYIENSIEHNMANASYEPISYKYDSDSVRGVKMVGEVTLGDDIFCVEIDPGLDAVDAVINFLKAVCEHYSIEFVCDINACIAAIESQYLV